MPRISCYYAEPVNGGREVHLTRYDQWLLPDHGIDELTTAELRVMPLAAATTFIQEQMREAGRSRRLICRCPQAGMRRAEG